MKKNKTKQMCMIQPHNFIMTYQEHILMNSITYLIQKEANQTPNDPANLIHEKYNHSEQYKKNKEIKNN